ncbi:sigma-70 family RNA polymerase sigma factor [Shewanella corallii]|uniref:Sigma-70 family RNA polymerase sigma factor n=1 Tax=Shewanella corallii TaxID=560080 RepID=A0ABT0N363_9GAMM|nr:sigma-70 family RNA polymerase sigma factor [Shewanella corallii]MCL2912896.1 sigma-70 family RNA polymerase sigma factor [Shewanella corallii]
MQLSMALANAADSGGSDEQLMLDYAAGDSGAFEQLYLKHKGPLYRYFVRQIGDRPLAEDLYQETWSRVIKAAAGYQPQAKFTTWLYRIAHNLLVDHVRAVKPVDLFTEVQTDNDSPDIGADEGEPGVSLEEEQKAGLLKECVSLLPQVQKEAFLLNCETGFPARVIAEIVGVSLEASKSRIRYAYQSLKECVASKWEASRE